MKKLIQKASLIIVTFIVLFNTGQLVADTIPDGDLVYGTWNIENSPYVIMGEILVPADCTLIIEPGVRVKLLSSNVDSAFNINTLGVGVIRIEGRLIAEGTENDTIVFERTGEGRWGSISVLDSSVGVNIIKYCKVSYGKDILHDFGIEYKGGLAFFDSKGIIEHSIFENNKVGIWFMRSNIDMRYNLSKNNSTGIYINNCLAQITCNNIYNNLRTGISSRFSNSVISSNIIENSGERGISCYETNDSVLDNIIRNNSWGGIELTRSTTVVKSNIIYGSNSGIRCGRQPYLINNTIVNNNYFGIYTDYAASPIIINSIIYGNQHLMTGLTYLDTVVFANCLLQVDTLPERSIDGGGNIFNEDPYFASTSNNEFSLNMNSPCIDAGTPLFVWEGDTIVNLTPDKYYGLAPDMGAIESMITNSSESQKPGSDILHQNYPNPFSNTTTIKFTIENATSCKLNILNISGNMIKSFDIAGIGEQSIVWDGTDTNGDIVQSGIYIYLLISGDNQYWKPMIFSN